MMEDNEVLLSEWDQLEIKAFATEQRGFEFSQFSLWLCLGKVIQQPKFRQLTLTQQQLCVMAIMQQRDWSEISKRLTFTGKAQCITALRQAVTSLLAST